MRRRVPRPRRASTTATVVQIALLTLTLVAVLSFHHFIANRTTALLEYLAPGESPPSTDAGAIAPAERADPPLARPSAPSPDAGPGATDAARAPQPSAAPSPVPP